MDSQKSPHAETRASVCEELRQATHAAHVRIHRHPYLSGLLKAGYQHSGFSVDAGVCIKAHDRAALERLLRYCARPPFAMDRLRKEGAELVYRCAKQRSEPSSDMRGAKVDELHLTPLEQITRIAALVPPPRTHLHRYFGVLAPNSPLRAAAVALAAPAKQVVVQTKPAITGEGAPGMVPLGHPMSPTPEPATPQRSPAHYLWAVLIARIYEVFPLLCPMCGGQMRRRMMGCTLSRQTGIWRRKRHPTTRSISASVGE